MTGLNFNRRRVGATEVSLPCLGFGGAALGGLFTTVDAGEARNTLAAGLAAGMVYVDTAPFYGFGRSERIVGDTLRGRDYILSTKVGRLLRPGPVADPSALGWPDGRPFTPEFDFGYDGIMRSFEDSLQRLGLDRIDILYVHDLDVADAVNGDRGHFRALAKSGYRALDELRQSGAIKAIGLGVNGAQICRDALGIGNWDLFLLAGRYTLLEQDPLGDLLPECAASGTSIIIGGPFNSGFLVGGETWNYGAVNRPEFIGDHQLK